MKHFYHFLMILFILGFTNKLYSQSVPSYVPSNGLVGWWGFNGNAQDGSGNGNHGTVNGATLTTDRFGNQNGAYSFDGINDFIDLNYLETINGSSQSSFNIWCISSFNNVLLGHWNSSFNPIGSVGININIGIDNKIYIDMLAGLSFNSLNQIDTSMWSMISVVYNGLAITNQERLKLFVNGQSFPLDFHGNNVPSLIGNQANSTFVGARGIGSGIGGFNNGNLDDIGIWNRALTQQEITNLYNSQLPTQTSLCLPTITTNTPSSIGIDSVIVGGNITNDGGSSIVLRGVCYSTTPNPNMGNMRTEDGSGVGSFSTILRNLNPSTTYYVRSYAKNSNGVVVYGDEVSFSTSSITIGSIYAGGIVFYVDSTGQHGLVCAPSDQGNFPWGCNWQFIGGTLSLLNTGQSNTNLIISNCSENNIAALICNNYTLGQYDDWYLPSFDELMLIFWSLQGHSSFSQQFYWSSSEDGAGYAKCHFFAHGSAGSQSNMKNVSQKVRAIRSF